MNIMSSSTIMPTEKDVEIRCDCGHEFTRKTLKAGNTVTCPKCKKTATFNYTQIDVYLE